MSDISDFTESWLDNDSNKIGALGLNEDCIINLYEFSEPAKNWSEGI